MSIQNQARSLLTQHQKIVVNRKRSMLTRVANEIGVDVDPKFHNHIQGKTINDIGNSFHNGAMS
jgi:hypothetical protein